MVESSAKCKELTHKFGANARDPLIVNRKLFLLLNSAQVWPKLLRLALRWLKRGELILVEHFNLFQNPLKEVIGIIEFEMGEIFAQG